MARRPFTVFVRDIGPTFTFKTSIAAHERARELVTKPGGYCEVHVWNRDRFGDRTVYRFDEPGRATLERFVSGRWVKVRPLVVPETKVK